MRPWYVILNAPRGPMGWRFILAVALNGPVFAAMRFGEVVARKSLDASPLQVTLLTMVMPLASLIAIFWGRMLEGRDQRKHMLVVGLVGAAALASGLFLTRIGHLFALFVLFYISFSFMLTGQNRLLQQHIHHKQRGGVFGLSSSVRMSVAALFSLLAGIWMDRHTQGFQQVYAVAGLFAVGVAIVFASMPTGGQRPVRQRENLARRVLVTPLRDVIHLLRRRKDYFRFQLGFMIYGTAFMMLLPTVPLFLVDDLALDYTTIGFAQGTVMQLVMIPAIFFFGRLFDRISPHLMAAGVFASLALHPMLLLAAEYLELWRIPLLYTAFAINGLSMGGVVVLWSIASVRFAKDEDAGVYQSVHVAATGVRGSFAPLIAYGVITTLGTNAALMIAASVWVIAGGFMFFLHRLDGPSLAASEKELGANSRAV